MATLDIKLADVVDGDNPIEGDLFLNSDGDMEFIEGAEAIAQHLRARFRFFKGEWFQNTDEGVPYFEEILEKGVSDGRVAEIFRQVILGTPGITSVTSISLDRDRALRLLTVNFEAVTDEGITIKSDDYGPFLVNI